MQSVRRHGAIRHFFESGLLRLYEEGHVLYRKFGYEPAIIRHNAKFSPGNLRKDLHRAAAISRILPDEPGCGMVHIVHSEQALGMLPAPTLAGICITISDCIAM